MPVESSVSRRIDQNAVLHVQLLKRERRRIRADDRAPIAILSLDFLIKRPLELKLLGDCLQYEQRRGDGES